jgi:hypothetical protein
MSIDHRPGSEAPADDRRYDDDRVDRRITQRDRLLWAEQWARRTGVELLAACRDGHRSEGEAEQREDALMQNELSGSSPVQ